MSERFLAGVADARSKILENLHVHCIVEIEDKLFLDKHLRGTINVLYNAVKCMDNRNVTIQSILLALIQTTDRQ